MKWFKIELTEQQLVSGELAKIVNEFNALFLLTEIPNEMSLWANKSTKPGETNTVYFSPVAADNSGTLIRDYNGKGCRKPYIEKVSLLVGRSNAWDIFLEK